MASRAPRTRAVRGLLLLLLALGLTLAAPTSVAVVSSTGISSAHHGATALPGRTSVVDPVLHAPLVGDVPSSTELTLTCAPTTTPADEVSSYRTRTEPTSRGPPAD